MAGRKFIIETDHKPLQHIFGEKRNLQKTVNHRLVRWATILNQYNYTLQFIKGSENTLADMLSRLPQQESTQTKGDDDPAIVHLIQDEAAEQSGLSLDSILSATNLDAELRLVKSYITRGWPTTMPTHLKAYQSHAQDLSIESGAIMCLGRIVIPSELRKKTLDHIHLGHPGIVAMKSLARTYVWWPKLSEEVEKYVLHCPECQKSRNTPPDYPLQNWPITSSPWERVHVDFAGPVKEQYYLLMQCAASKWSEVLPIASLHAHTTTYSVECHGRYIRGHIDQLRRRYRKTERQVVSGFDWPAIETSDTTYEKNDKERNSDDATRNDLEQPAENLASTEKIVTETLGSNTDANLQQENGPHNDSNQAMTVLR
ncbi:hypothetical protein GJ496_010403 [Pomphorhynchus laevis]|nr:hypothetical protein GJ496_010403 [Pomphorhynchus laevis]